MNPLSQMASGIVILGEWLGSGGTPVRRQLAENRSTICESCPLNTHGKWWEKSKDVIAQTIRLYIQVKQRYDIRVANEDRLFMCSACGCATMLKVHTPLKHILEHTTPEQLQKLDPACWILSETKQ